MSDEASFFHEFKTGVTDFADKAQEAGKKAKDQANKIKDDAKDKLNRD